MDMQRDKSQQEVVVPNGLLPQLLHLLQGASEPSLADVGITRLDGSHLDALQRLARQQADVCLDYAEVVLTLLEDSVNGSTDTLARVLPPIQQLQRMLMEFRRWRDLADNAAYYRDHPGIHARIALALD